MIYIILTATSIYLAYRQYKQEKLILQLRRQLYAETKRQLYAEIHGYQYPQNWK